MKYIESNGYLFAMDEYKAYDVQIYQFVAMSKQPYPCIKISIYKGVANIDTLNYYANCSLSEKLLDKAIGTIYMMKTALAYVSQRHSTIMEYEIQDETFVNMPGKPLITARRLLQGEKGWYEEHFGAIPTQRTVLLLDWLRDPQHFLLFRDKIPKVEKTWWSASNVMKVCSLIGCPYSVIGTTWCIQKNSIINYNITYIEKEMQSGGANDKKFKRIIKNAKGLCHTTVLEAKYRNNE